MADFSSLLGAAGVGGSIGRAIVQLELDTAKYQAEMKAAQVQTTTGANSMSGALASFGGAAKAGVGIAAVAVGAFAVNAISAASDLGEAVNKSNVIFGDNAAEIEKWAEGGAEAFGLSKTAALDAAGGFGAMLQTAGLAVDESANMSKSLVELSGDMASFNNIDPTEALEKLRSGLAGEAEPLRRFGVFLSEAAVQQEAYQSGIAAVGEELTEAQKVQARYNIIFEQTTKQQGDFQRTAESLPNQLRTMRAEFENISAEVGEKLIPVATTFMEILRDLLPVLKLVGDALAAVVEVVSDLVSALTLQGNEFDTLSGKMQELGQGVRDGTVTLVEFDNQMRRLAEQTELNFSVTEEYERALHLAREEQEHAAFAAERLRVSNEGAMHSLEDVGKSADKARKDLVGFANMTGEELEDWRLDTKEAFRGVILGFEDVSTQSEITEKDLLRGFRDMREDAREFRNAMRELGQKSNEWIPEDFRVYLAELGPQALISFADTNKKQKERLVEDWEAAQRGYNQSLKTSFLDLDERLGDLDKKTTNHFVRIKYDYVGFDPSKPGMGQEQ